MRWIESLRLQIRARKYERKNDPGGIAYLKLTIQPGQTVFDVGAHKAGYLYFMLQRTGAKGTVVAFEPQPGLFHYLQQLRQQLDWSNVQLEPLALSDEAGSTTLYVPDQTDDSGASPGATIVKEIGIAGFQAAGAVQTDTLDAYCERHHLQPHFLKIDVEGNELNVLKGGQATLLRCRPKILVEIEARHVGEETALATFDYLQGLGYKGYFIFGTEKLPLSVFNFEKHQQPGKSIPYCNNFVFE